MALLVWAGTYLPGQNITSLSDISGLSKPELAAEIDKLNAALYSRQHPHWEGQTLWQLIAPLRKPKSGQDNTDNKVLAELYPDVS